MNITVSGRRGWGTAVVASGLFALFLVLASADPLKAQFAGAGGTTGITLAVADWVPARDKDYGGWGVVAAGGSIETPLQWTKDAPTLALDPGSYDVYWTQDYDTRDRPILIAKGVTVEADALTTVNVDSGARIEIAAWVPARDKDYGWWGAAPVGTTTADEPVTTDQMVNWSKSADALLLPAGAYDVYWVQEYDTRGKPIVIAKGVTVKAGPPATIKADSGVRIEIAAWVPARDKDYGWWGAAPVGSTTADEPVTTDQMVNWSKSADALLLPAGAYDVYWVQEYDTRGRPIAIAKGVTVKAGPPATVKAASGVRIETAAWVPARDKDYGWWGAAPVGSTTADGPVTTDQMVNWSKSADALLLPAGAYDVYWVQNYATRGKPILIAKTVNVQAGEFGGVGIEIAQSDGAIRVVTPIGGGPADRAGIRAGDVVAAVDGESLDGKTLAQAVESLRGAVGAPVEVTIRRDGGDQVVAIERAAMSTANVIRVNTGLRPVVAADVPPLDKDYGWWGAAPAWRGPDNRVNWAEGQAADPLVLPPGRYDIYWRTDINGAPQLKVREVEVAFGSLIDVPIGAESIVVTPSAVVAFNVRPTDGSAFADGALPEGVDEIEARYEWKEADVGRRLGVRWFKDDQMVLEQGEPIATVSGETTWALKMQDGSVLPTGKYRVELMENGELRVPVEFTIGTAAAPPPGATSAAEVSVGENTVAAEPDAGAGQPPDTAGAGTGGEWAIMYVVTEGDPSAVDDFSDPKSGWTMADSSAGHTGYADNAYHIALDATGEGWVLGTNGTLIGDAILQVDAGDAPGSSQHPFGVFVRSQDKQNFHAFIVATDESYAAFHVENGAFRMDGAPDQKLPAGVFRHDGPNQIRVFLAGDRIVYFLNDREIDRAKALWPTGTAGVLSANVEAGESDVVFDDWKIWSMASNEPAVEPSTPTGLTTAVAAFKFEVTIPTVDAVGSSIDSETLRAILSGDLASHAEELAMLRAESIRIPELKVTYDLPAVDGKVVSVVMVYRDIQVSDVTGGVAQSVSVAGADVTMSDGGSARFGRMSTGVFDIGGLLRFYGLAQGEPAGAPKTIYENLVFDGGTATAPSVDCTIGPVTVASVKARPLKMSVMSLAALIAAAQTAQANGETPSPETISELVGFYADLLDAFETSPINMSGFECSGTGDDGKPIAVSLGAVTIGAFGHGHYPEVAVKDLKIAADTDGQLSIGSVLVKGFDFSGPMAVLKGAAGAIDEAWLATHFRQLIPAFGGWSVSDFKMDVPDDENPGERIKASVAAFDLSLRNYVNGIPTDISTSASHIAVVLPGKIDAEPIQKLMALGIDKLDIGYEISANWDAPSQQITLRKLSLTGVDMGAIAVTGVIGEATDDLFSNDTTAALAAALGLTVKGITVDVEDAGLADLLLQVAADEQDKDVAEFRTELSGIVQGTILVMLGGTPDAAKLSQAVGAFLGGAKSLSIDVAAKDEAGLGMGELQALQEDPAALGDLVTIDAAAE